MKKIISIVLIAILTVLVYGKPVRNALGAKGGEKGIRLPYDAEVEYLESTGTQWIDTGINPDSTISANIIFSQMSFASNTTQFIFGSEVAFNNNSFCLIIRSTGRAQPMFGKSVSSYVSIDLSATNSAQLKKGLFLCNGSSITLTDDIASNPNAIYLFGDNRNGTRVEQVRGRIHRFGLTKGEQEVRDMIPVRFTNELGVSEGAMYDRVSGQLFRNQGSGSFVIGPDKN